MAEQVDPLLLPITLAIFGFLRRWQERHVFRRLGIDVGKDVSGFVDYLAVSQVLTAAAALQASASLCSAERGWK